MMNEVVEAILSDRRREAAKQRRIAIARRAASGDMGVPAWRVRVGGWLFAAGAAIRGPVVAPVGAGRASSAGPAAADEPRKQESAVTHDNVR